MKKYLLARSLDDTSRGVLTAPIQSSPTYRTRDLMRHCRAKGITPMDLTADERKQFETVAAEKTKVNHG